MAVKFTKPEINITEKVAELDKPSGIAGEAMLRAETSQEQFNLIGAGRKNLIINGSFNVSQRGSYSSATAVINNRYYIDRWNLDFSGVSATIQNNSTDLPNGTTAKTAKIAATSTGGAGYLQIRQRIEVESWMDNQTVTVSAWVKSNTAYPRLRVEGASTTTNQDSTHIYSGSGSWEFLTMTLTLRDAISTLATGVILWNGSPVAISSGDYVEISQVQVELGKVATPFEHRSYGKELDLCKRYYQRIQNGQLTGARNTGTRLRLSAPLSPEMRSSPSVSRISGTTVSVQGDGLGFTSTQTAAAQGSPSGTTFMGFDLAGFTGIVDRTYPGSQSTVEVFECDAEL